jgi:hypothetical protein
VPAEAGNLARARQVRERLVELRTEAQPAL